MNPTVALPGSMTWMGIRLSSGSHPQSPKGLPPRKRCETYESVRFFTTAILSGARFKRYLRYTHPRLPERQLWHGPPAPGSLYDCKDRRTKGPPQIGDRKSTRLNSSHLGISYAVFCLKKTVYSFTNDISQEGNFFVNTYPAVVHKI